MTLSSSLEPSSLMQETGLKNAQAEIGDPPSDGKTWLRQHAREYGQTFLTEFLVLACQLLVYKLAAHLLGKQGFAEYAIARRTISLIYPVTLLGLGIALPRYIALASGAGEDFRPERYFGAAAWCVGAALAFCALLMNIFRDELAYLFFGGREYANLMPPLSLLLIGLTLHALAYAYFRGHLTMKRANLLQLLNLGAIPLISFAIVRDNVAHVLFVLGLFTMLCAGGGLLLTPFRSATSNVLPEARELLSYGLQRVPGNFLQMALFMLPVALMAHLRGVKEAGFMAFSISLLSMVGAIFAPVGLVLLPKASRMIAAGEHGELRAHVLRLSMTTTAVAAGITLLCMGCARPIIRLYLGPGFEGVALMVRTIGVAILPYALYCVLRSLVDARYTRAMNMWNTAIAFAAFLLLAGIILLTNMYALLPAAFAAAIVLQGVLTIAETRKIFV